MMKPTSHARGLWAELLAILYLFFKGYNILVWRYKTRLGEIDIIARKGEALVFIEVKARADMDDALQSVTPRMRQRIGRAARHYVSAHQRNSFLNLRYDLIAISGFKIQHLDNAWPDHT